MVTKETQGEEKQCYDYLLTPQENCEGLICAHECTMQHGGNGVCVDTTSTVCICTYDCTSWFVFCYPQTISSIFDLLRWI